ncbi:hypothetical protein WJX72_012397 [[Myrmecia] bisecta]|uniref:EKC/KEOPS complex subunit CGI121 n=1 Tax=[Myrmecia] bisecta TaxID=41462 RepID=A0AAW1PHG1_9CHLO
MEQVFEFEGLCGRTLHVWLFINVSNSKDILQKLIGGQLPVECVFVNATLVPDLIVLRAAAHKALTADQRQRLKTKSLHSEMLYNISGSKHIGETLKRFGIAEGSQHLLVARFDASEEDAAAIKAVVAGQPVALEQLHTLTDTATVTKYYKISPEELKIGSLADAILCRIAARDC